MVVVDEAWNNNLIISFRPYEQKRCTRINNSVVFLVSPYFWVRIKNEIKIFTLILFYWI